MKRPDIKIATITSEGPKEYPVSNGSTYVKATPCVVCAGPIEAGEFIAKVGTPSSGERWAHRDCAQQAISGASLRNAWALLGADVARRPRAYSTRDVRTIVGHLVEMVYRDELEDEFVGGEERRYTVDQAEALIRLVAEGGELPVSS